MREQRPYIDPIRASRNTQTRIRFRDGTVRSVREGDPFVIAEALRMRKDKDQATEAQSNAERVARMKSRLQRVAHKAGSKA